VRPRREDEDRDASIKKAQTGRVREGKTGEELYAHEGAFSVCQGRKEGILRARKVWGRVLRGGVLRFLRKESQKDGVLMSKEK